MPDEKELLANATKLVKLLMLLEQRTQVSRQVIKSISAKYLFLSRFTREAEAIRIMILGTSLNSKRDQIGKKNKSNRHAWERVAHIREAELVYICTKRRLPQ